MARGSTMARTRPRSRATHTRPIPPWPRELPQAFAGFDRARMERDFPLQDGGKELGVATPKMVILAYRPKDLQPLAQYAVGDVAPDKYSRYILPVGKPQVVTIANYQIDNLTALIDAVARPAAAGAPAAAARSGGRRALAQRHAGAAHSGLRAGARASRDTLKRND